MSKKVMPIYKFLVFLFLSHAFSLFAQDDVATYCFDTNVSLNSVRQAIDFILTEKDKVSLRREDNCLDIVTTENRKKLLDKYVTRKYNLKNETPPPVYRECHIDFKTLTKKKTTSEVAKVGKQNGLTVTDATANSESTASMLLGAGFAGTLNLGTQTLQIVCRPSDRDGFDLTFYFDDKNKATVSTSLFVKSNEVVNIANVTNTLNEKNKTLGLPQTSFSKTEGAEDITFELKVY